MNPETPKNSSSETLTRKQKLLRRFLPLLLVAGGGAAAAHEMTTDDDKSPEASATSVVHAQAVSEFGGSESNWGHGAAERAIRQALHDAVPRAFANLHPGNVSDSDYEQIRKIAEDLPVYEQAEAALEKAGYVEAVPDPGDKLTVDIEVTADINDHVSYEVKGAEIEDIVNTR